MYQPITSITYGVRKILSSCHPWVLLQDPASGPAQPGQEQLVLFYFTHGGKKTYMQMAEMTLGPDGKLRCDRNQYAQQ